MFRDNARDGAPSPDGRTIAYTVEDGREIRVAQFDGSEERSIARGSSDQVLGALFWSANGKRISYQERSPSLHGSTEIESNFEWHYRSRDIRSGRETTQVSDLSFDSAQETGDGRLVYLRSYPPNDYAHNGIWMVKINPVSGSFIGTPDRIFRSDINLATGLSVTADGKQVAAVKQYDEQADIYVADLVHPSLRSMGAAKEHRTASASGSPRTSPSEPPQSGFCRSTVCHWGKCA